MPIKRISIEPADAALLLGKCPRTCQKLFVKIKEHYNKKKHHVVVVEEFCEYLGIKDIESVKKMIR